MDGSQGLDGLLRLDGSLGLDGSQGLDVPLGLDGGHNEGSEGKHYLRNAELHVCESDASSSA